MLTALLYIGDIIVQKQIKIISVAGFEIPLSEIPKKELKGVIVDDIARFFFY